MTPQADRPHASKVVLIPHPEIAVWRSGIEAMFNKIGEASDWVYPTASRIEQVGGLKAWLWHSEPEARWAAGPRDSVRGYVEVTSYNPKEREVPEEQAEYWNQALFSKPQASKMNLTPESVLTIGRLGVSPDAQNQGLGRELMNQAVSFIHSKGKTPALVVLQHLPEAQRLYQKMGFQSLGEATGYSGKPITTFVLKPSR